jgi:hypothetical protein
MKGVFFARWKCKYYGLSQTERDWGKGDSGGPRQVVHSTRTGFGFSFVLHRPFRPRAALI